MSQSKAPQSEDSIETNVALLLSELSAGIDAENAARLKKFIDALVAALGRIENGTYGICTKTGELIPKGRLMAVPHATMSVAAKLNP